MTNSFPFISIATAYLPEDLKLIKFLKFDEMRKKPKNLANYPKIPKILKYGLNLSPNLKF